MHEVGALVESDSDEHFWVEVGSFGPSMRGNAAAIAALPEYVAEVERLRAWWDSMSHSVLGVVLKQIRAGEWPEGRQP